MFCKTKQSVDQVTRDLKRREIAAQAIHGDKSQQTRLETLSAFKEGSLRVLVATDVAARGLDIAELPFVINYELPTQAEDYVHRIGRTGRAGADGVAISLMDENEQKMFESIKELINKEIPVERIEGFEPRWWSQEEGVVAEVAVNRETRRENNRDSGRERSNNRNVAAKASATRESSRDNNRRERSNEPKDAGDACGRIAGRSRRSRRERPKCALVQPNYGA